MIAYRPDLSSREAKKMRKRRKAKVVAYVDGFNLYFGLRDSKWRRYYWLNVGALCNSLLRENQELLVTKSSAVEYCRRPSFRTRSRSPTDTSFAGPRNGRRNTKTRLARRGGGISVCGVV